MIDLGNRDRVVRVRNLQEFFHASINDVVARQRVDIDPHASHYVVNLLTIFSRSDQLYEEHTGHYGLKPLALMLADAADTDRLDHRNYLLQRIGDVALFIAGFFADGLAGKAADVDYYIYMGGSAYDSLSEEVRSTFRGRALAPVYRELAAKFQVLVDVLNEMADGARESSDIDLLRAYEVWLKTGSRRAESLLRQSGVEPLQVHLNRRHWPMLERLQQKLHDINRSDTGYDIHDFLVTDARIARAISGGDIMTNSGEALLLREDEHGVALSLYLDEALLDRLKAGDPATALRSGLLDDLCKVIEGLSHFNYVAWRASRDRSVTLLELELQAEVDKYVSTMQLAHEKRDTELMKGLHGRLFDNPRFHAHLSRRQLERYSAASEYAARFCQALVPRLLEGGGGALPELRRFYRMSLGDKISHIHAQSWAGVAT